MKKLINTHTVILQKHEELLARSAIDKKFNTCSTAAVVARAYPTSQVQPTCLPSRRKTCRGSQIFNPHPHHSTLFQVFVKLPCPCQVRCPGNQKRGFMKKLINTHTVILQKQEELFARSAVDKNSIPDKREALVVYRQSASLRVPKKDCLRTSWSSLPVVGSTRPRLPVQNAHRNRLNDGKK